MKYTAKVITVSDRSFRGERPDAAGPVVEALLREAGYALTESLIVPDERAVIAAALREAAAQDVALIVTTGGTGFAPRDVTPEATMDVVERPTPGIGEAMRYASLQITPRAMLSRAASGIVGSSLIVNLPGSPKAAKENLEAVLGALDHGLTMLRGGQADCAVQQKS